MKIKDALNIEQTLQRIAYQILECNTDNHEIVLAGIVKNGAILAKRLESLLESISKVKIHYAEIAINKMNPRVDTTISIPIEQCENKMVVVIDDVLNTGMTLIYATHYFLSIPLHQLRTVVLVNRNHKKFPIKADFKGLSLSTSIKEHINVVLEGSDQGIFLT